MGFSITGNLLHGSMQRPDTVTFIFSETKNIGFASTKELVGSTNCKLNQLGYIPVVSIITGLGRLLLAIIHTIVHLVCAIFSKNREHHLQEASLGAKNIVRGLVEVIPIIGNITMFVVDLLRINKFEKMAKEHIERNKAAYNNQAVMFTYGQEIAKRPIAEFNVEVAGLNRKPTQADVERIIRNQN